jgi:hypothetical protein
MTSPRRLGSAVVTTVILLSFGAAPAAQGRPTGAAGLHPGRFSFFAPAPVLVTLPGGPNAPSRPDCTAHQISAAAFTEPSTYGVEGVVELKGTKFYRRPPYGRVRCALPFTHGPRRFIAADGSTVAVPRSHGDPTNPGDDPFSYVPLTNGRAAWGFGWFGTYCGAAPRYVVMRLARHRGLLNVPYDGPAPSCPVESTAASTLVDGSASDPAGPVQPAAPAYADLVTSASFNGTTTRRSASTVEVTISDTGADPVDLDPCPLYAVRTSDKVRGHFTFGSYGTNGKSPGCKKEPLTVTPTQPISFRVDQRLTSRGGAFHAPKGSTFTVWVDLAGMPSAEVSTTVS